MNALEIAKKMDAELIRTVKIDILHNDAAALAQPAVCIDWPAGSVELHRSLLQMGKSMAKERSREIGDAWNQLADLLTLLAKSRCTPPPAEPAVEPASDDLRDMLVAISAAIADQDDRAAQAMIREILSSPPPPAEVLKRAAEAACDAIAFNGGSVQMEAHVRAAIEGVK